MEEQPANVLQTDVDGRCLFTPLEVGDHAVTVTSAGNVTLNTSVRISTGVTSRRKYILNVV